MKLSLHVLLFVMWMMGTSMVWAGTETVPARMEAIKASLTGVTSISGSFKQTKELDFFKEPLVSEGSFYFSHPDYLQWEYITPVPSGIVIDGGKARAWAGKKASKQSAAMVESARLVAGQVMIWMNMDTETILSTYEILVASKAPLIFQVKPKRKEAQKFLKSLEVEFNLDNRSVRRVALHEPNSRTTLVFDKITFNARRPPQ